VGEDKTYATVCDTCAGALHEMYPAN
jgi:hypothetical protein